MTITVSQNQALPPIIRIVPDICGKPAAKKGLREQFVVSGMSSDAAGVRTGMVGDRPVELCFCVDRASVERGEQHLVTRRRRGYRLLDVSSAATIARVPRQ